MSFLAPQGYTKETLVEAFAWLQHQPATIREAATTPDTLVSLFLRAQRHGITTAKRDAASSSKQFLKELKDLKQDMDEFDSSPEESTEAEKDLTKNAEGTTTQDALLEPEPTPPPVYAPTPTAPEITTPPTSRPSPEASVISSPAKAASQASVEKGAQQSSSHNTGNNTSVALDERSLQTLHRVQQQLNLSSPIEALRLLISLGSRSLTKNEMLSKD